MKKRYKVFLPKSLRWLIFPIFAFVWGAVTVAALSPEVTRAWYARPTAAPRKTRASVEIPIDQPLAAAIEQLEREFIARALELSAGRVTQAAGLLGLSRKGLFLKRRRLGLPNN